MKNIFKNLKYAFVALAFVACETENNVIDDVFASVENGAFLRLVTTDGSSINKADTSSAASITYEFDGVDPSLLSSIEFTISFVDRDDADGVEESVGPVPFGSATAADLSPSQFGKPSGVKSYTLAEALSTLGLSVEQINGGDRFQLGMTATLTDGRSFGPGQANGNVSAVGGYYSSPYVFTSSVVCLFPITPGQWTVRMYDSYGDGWQTGAEARGLRIVLADGSTFAEVGLCSFWDEDPYDCTDELSEGVATIDVPAGLGLVDWVIDGDVYNEISFEIESPSGNIVGSYGPGTAGVLPVNLCNEPVQ